MDEYLKQYQDYLQEQNDTTNTLYHYTSVNSLMSIISNKCIWTSSVLFQNDRKELNHSLSMLAKQLDVFKSKKGITEKRLRNLLENFQEYYSIFTFSLSEYDDQLSQWRGYTKNESGSISIGFSIDGLRKYTNNEIDLLPVVYDDQLKIQFINEYLKDYDCFLSIYMDHFPPSEKEMHLEDEFTKYLFRLLASFKDRAYFEEKEWRVAVLSNRHNDLSIFERKAADMNTVKHRCRGKYIIPYIEVPFNGDEVDKVIRSITIGPDSDLNDLYSNVNSYLIDLGIDNISLRKSRIDLRKQ